MTDAEFVEVMAARARRQYPGGVEVIDRELAHLVALARRALGNANAERLADEVAALVRRGVLDARCPAADALLDYREPPATPRADRLASLDTQLADVGARLIWWRDRWTSEQARVRELEEVFSVERLRAAREHAHRTFNGGHEDDAMRRAFHHGMDTVFNMLDADAALARRAP